MIADPRVPHLCHTRVESSGSTDLSVRLEDRSCQFLEDDFDLVPELAKIPVPPLGGLPHVLPCIDRVAAPVAEREDVRPVRYEPLKQSRKLEEKRTDRSKRVVAEPFDRDHNRSGGHDRRDLLGGRPSMR